MHFDPPSNLIFWGGLIFEICNSENLNKDFHNVLIYPESGAPGLLIYPESSFATFGGGRICRKSPSIYPESRQSLNYPESRPLPHTGRPLLCPDWPLTGGAGPGSLKPPHPVSSENDTSNFLSRRLKISEACLTLKQKQQTSRCEQLVLRPALVAHFLVLM